MSNAVFVFGISASLSINVLWWSGEESGEETDEDSGKRSGEESDKGSGYKVHGQNATSLPSRSP